MANQRKTGKRDEFDAAWVQINYLVAEVGSILSAARASLTRVLGYATIANATTAGKLKTTSTVGFSIAGQVYSKAAADNLWDLSAQADTDGTHYKAFWLYVDASGTASIGAGTAALSSAAAVLALPAEDATKCPFGVFIAGPSTDFDDAGGLTAQGTVVHGRPAALAPEDPAAQSSTSTTLVAP